MPRTNNDHFLNIRVIILMYKSIYFNVSQTLYHSNLKYTKQQMSKP